jgi:hypothetical protein
MYLHLGQNVVVPTQSVVAVFDMDNATSSHITRTFLENAEKHGRVVIISDDIPKSFVLCRDGEKTVIYLSQLASSTLLKRSGQSLFNNLNISDLSDG